MLALAGCIVALLLIVNSFRDDESSTGSGSGKQATTSQGKGGKDKPDVPKTYTVHEGDNLGTISQQFGVPVAKIEELNPDIDTQILNAGQEIFLR